MSSVIDLYEQLNAAPDERARSRLIADAFHQMEARYPAVTDLVTRTALSETELRLQKEVEAVRLETEKVRGEIRGAEGRLWKEIEQVRGELRESEARLQKEIEQVRAELKLDIEQLRGDVARLKLDLLKWLVPLMFGQVLAIAALVKLL